MTPGETHVKQGGNGSERKTVQQGVNVLLSCLRLQRKFSCDGMFCGMVFDYLCSEHQSSASRRCIYICIYLHIGCVHIYINPLHHIMIITSHHIISYYITYIHSIPLPCLALPCLASYCITVHYSVLHYITLHYTTLHYVTMQYIALHYTAL